METRARVGISDQATRELKDQGRDDLVPTVTEAIRGVAASHAGRPVDEVQWVLHEAVEDTTHMPSVLSDAALEELARQISKSARHA
jgi:hypothetical protein